MARNKRIFAFLFVLTFTISLLSSNALVFDNVYASEESEGVKIILNDTFEDSKTNMPPAGWGATNKLGINEELSSILVKELEASSNKVVEIDIQNSARGQDPYITNIFYPTPKGKLILEYKIRMEDVGSSHTSLLLRSESNETSYFIIFNQEGMITAYDGSIVKSLQPYVTRRWYHIILVMDTNTQKYDVYINNNLKLKQADFHSKGLTDIKQLRIQKNLHVDGNNARTYLDDIRMYTGDIILKEDELAAIEESSDDDVPAEKKPTIEEVRQKINNTITLYLNNPNAYVGNKRVTIDEDPKVKPLIKDGITLVPVRFISESLGAVVDWEPSTSVINISLDNEVLSTQLGSNIININGVPSTLDAPTQVINNKIFIPLRALVEALGKKVFWDDRTKLIVISDQANILDEEQDKILIDEIVKLIIFDRPTGAEIIKDLRNNHPQNSHPRIMATQETFNNIKANLATDQYVNELYTDVKNQADVIINQPATVYEIPDGMRMPAGGIVREKIEVLALVYKISGEGKYAERVWLELEAASNFPDWNPSHFLDTAGMTSAFAIGYDWCYDYWTESQKTIIINAIKEKGLEAGLVAYRNPTSGTPNRTGWATDELRGASNWNVVANGGMLLGALAIADKEEELAKEILDGALKGIEYALTLFTPEGAWNEGLGYWSLTTTYLTIYLSTLDASTGTTYGHFDYPGVAETGYYPMYLTGPTGTFNYHDDIATKYINAPQMFWFANKLNDPELATLRFSVMNDNMIQGGAYDLLFYNPENSSQVVQDLALDKFYPENEIAVFRSAWNDSETTYIGFHAGQNDISHGDLDSGNFIMDALGQRWAVDLGRENYNVFKYWDYNLVRWTYYRKRAEGQNTLVINPGEGPDQEPTAFTRIIDFESKAKGAYAIADLTPAYANDVNQAKRGMMLTKNRSVAILQDELTAKSPSEIYWFMHTKANIQVSDDGKSAILEQKGKRLWVGIQQSLNNAVFTTMDAVPLPTSPNPPSVQNPNEGIKKLVIHLTDITDLKLTVAFAPLRDGETVPSQLPNVTSLEDWSIPDGNISVKDLIFKKLMQDGEEKDITQSGLTFGIIKGELIVENNNPIHSNSAAYILALYKEGKLIDISYMQNDIESKVTDNFRAKVIVPEEDIDKYSIKVLVWTAMEEMKPLINPYEFLPNMPLEIDI